MLRRAGWVRCGGGQLHDGVQSVAPLHPHVAPRRLVRQRSPRKHQGGVLAGEPRLALWRHKGPGSTLPRKARTRTHAAARSTRTLKISFDSPTVTEPQSPRSATRSKSACMSATAVPLRKLTRSAAPRYDGLRGPCPAAATSADSRSTSAITRRYSSLPGPNKPSDGIASRGADVLDPIARRTPWRPSSQFFVFASRALIDPNSC